MTDEAGSEMVWPALLPTTPMVVLAQPRYPGTFCRTDHLDVEVWMATYERVSAQNKWHPTIMLANLVFHLQGTAKVWYHNHGEELNDCDTCEQKLRNLCQSEERR